MAIPSAFSLNGKRAVVTGGSRGIGTSISRSFASLGADVCIGYRSRSAVAKRLVHGKDHMAQAGLSGEQVRTMPELAGEIVMGLLEGTK